MSLMRYSTRLYALTITGLLILIATGAAILAANSAEAQPRFRNFQPPRNPVASSVDHRFEFPNEIRNEVRRNQRQPASAYSGFVRVFDELETVSVMIPAQWNDVEVDWAISGDHESGVIIVATGDLNAYRAGDAPGMTLLATPDAVPDASVVKLLDEEAASASGQCPGNRFSRTNYRDPHFTGYYDFYSGCRNQFSIIRLVAVPGSGAATIVLEAAIRNEADLGAVKTAFESFELLGVPGHDHHHDHEDDEEHNHGGG
jgi:hypothetical protein